MWGSLGTLNWRREGSWRWEKGRREERIIGARRSDARWNDPHERPFVWAADERCVMSSRHPLRCWAQKNGSGCCRLYLSSKFHCHSCACSESMSRASSARERWRRVCRAGVVWFDGFVFGDRTQGLLCAMCVVRNAAKWVWRREVRRFACLCGQWSSDTGWAGRREVYGEGDDTGCEEWMGSRCWMGLGG